MASLNENLIRLSDARDSIATAISGKGVTVPSGSGYLDFANLINNITNTYTSSDEGKVVSNGNLVSQTATSTTTNGTIDTTLNNSIVVNVPTYSSADNGKVVSNGNLISQTARPSSITTNGTYATTTYKSVTVNVPTMDTTIINLETATYNGQTQWTTLYAWIYGESLCVMGMGHGRSSSHYDISVTFLNNSYLTNYFNLTPNVWNSLKNCHTLTVYMNSSGNLVSKFENSMSADPDGSYIDCGSVSTYSYASTMWFAGWGTLTRK